MINRVKEYFGEPPEERPPIEEYWEVAGDAGYFIVSRETALELDRQLRRRRPPRWVTFRDLLGSETRLRSKQIDCISECTAAQRAAARGFRRARRLEEKADRRPWEEDE